MDLRRLRAGEWITALGGGALLVALFLPWFGELSGWEAFAAVDVVLALAAAVALALAPITAAQPVPALPLALDALIALSGKVALVLVLVELIWPPDAADGTGAGLWLALAGTLAIVAGGWIAMRDDRRSKPNTDLTGRPVSAQPEIETLPAPSPGGPAR